MAVNVHSFEEYFEPRSLDELYALTSVWGKRAKIVAGGTDLLVRLKQRTYKPEALLSLQKIKEIQEITSGSDGITIGAGVNLSDVVASPLVGEEYPLLAEAAAKVGAYQHRYMGTIGGNLCLETRCLFLNQSHFLRDSLGPCLKAGGKTCAVVKGEKCYAVYSGDTAPALLALDAKAVIGSAAGERREDLAQIYSGNGLTPLSLKDGEVLTGIFIGKETARESGVYLKLAARIAIDYPSLGVAASISVRDKEIARVGLAFTAAGSAPFAAESAKDLTGAEQISESLLEPILAEVGKKAFLVKNTNFSVSYRRAMLGKMTGAALKLAWEKANGLEGGCCSE